MRRAAWHLILLALFLVLGGNTLAAEDIREERPAESEDEQEPVLSEEDREVLAHMELLALMDLLKDMELLESLEDKR